MNRITRMDPLSEDLFFEAIKPKKWDARIQWASAMLVAHVETDQGPDLRILRAELDDGSAHRVNAGPEDASAESMIFIDGNDLILSLSTTPFESGDASLVIGFELLVPVRVTACIVGPRPPPRRSCFATMPLVGFMSSTARVNSWTSTREPGRCRPRLFPTVLLAQGYCGSLSPIKANKSTDAAPDSAVYSLHRMTIRTDNRD